MIKLLLIAGLVLSGYAANSHGFVGVLIGSDGTIFKVHHTSPAHDAGLEKGDQVLEADNTPGKKNVDGDAGTVAHLKVRKKGSGEIIYLDIPRVPKWEIKD